MDLGQDLIRWLFKVVMFAIKLLPKVIKLLWSTGTLLLAIVWLIFRDVPEAWPLFAIGWLWAAVVIAQLIMRKATHDPKWSFIKLISGRTVTAKERAMTDPTIAKELKASEPAGFIFGTKGIGYIRKAESTDGHILVVGGVGSGKSSCLAIPSLLSWQERVFAIDIKGELSKKTQKQRQNMKIFNPTDPTAYGYNPFAILENSKNKTQDITEIVLALVPLPADIKDPYWIESSQDLLKGGLMYFYNKGCSFIESVNLIQTTPVTQLVQEISESSDQKAKIFVNQFVGLDPKTLGGIFSQLSKNILLFATDEEIQNALMKDRVVSPKDLEKGIDVYLAIPENMLEQWENLLTLMVNQFLKHFERRPDEGAAPILFLLDEFPRLGKIEAIINGLATLRSKKITIALFIQSIAQLDRIYGEPARKVILDTCSYRAVLSATDGDTQEYLSRLVGTYDKNKTSSSANYEQMTGMGTGTGTSLTSEEKRIIKPEEFASLPDIVLLSPFGFNRIEKAPYYKNAIFKDLV